MTQIDCLNRLRDQIYADAVAHGLWESAGGPPAYLAAARLILGEALELLEAAYWLDSAYRLHMEGAADDDSLRLALDHFCEELADVMISCLSSCGEMCIDADMVVAAKMEVNKGRSHRHEHD
ncbi:MAG: hypothetical protein IJD94_05175 [Clostridia bacterium]|nr:hypothetical protein [Clostridia bacterium]